MAAGRLPVKRHLGLTSLLVTGYRLAFLGFFFFLHCFGSPPIVQKEEEEGGLHLLHGKSVCGVGEIFRVIGGEVEQRYPEGE